MKPLYAVCLLILTLSLFSSCKKDELKSRSKEFVGTWELRKDICTFCAGPASTSYSQGNGNVIILSKNGNFERKENNVTTYKGTYTLTLKPDCGSNIEKVFFTTSEYDSEHSIEINDDGMLFIGLPDCIPDGSMSYYERVD